MSERRSERASGPNCHVHRFGQIHPTVGGVESEKELRRRQSRRKKKFITGIKSRHKEKVVGKKERRTKDGTKFPQGSQSHPNPRMKEKKKKK